MAVGGRKPHGGGKIGVVVGGDDIVSIARLRGIGEILAEEIAGEAVAGEADVKACADYDAILAAKGVERHHVARFLVEEVGDVSKV